MALKKWDPDKVPDLSEHVVVITGASTGLGKENARVLASKNATVVLAVRSQEKGEVAAADILRSYPSARLSVKILDLASLASVRDFTTELLASYDRLDLLINNAGVMMCPYSHTVDGFEMQLGTNHLGHFALTLQLLPLLKKTPNSRIVVLSSLAHKRAKLDLDDLHWQARKYNTGIAYSDSKLANLLFALELVERLKSEGNHPLVTVAHPGVAQTDLARHSALGAFITKLTSQPAEEGALPTLRAAFDKDVSPGDFFGPGGFLEMRGDPVKVTPSAKSVDKAAAQKLWQLSEEMTGIKWENVS